ncbi:MAG: rod-binding protein [Desulfobacteraceae bacterium]|nr:rod-binding protein [Desulfobacteraceae bacterium]
MADPIVKVSPPIGAMGKAALGAKKPNTEQLLKACQDFEAIFVQQMMQQMRQTVPQNGLFSGGRAEEIYTSMMDDELSKTFAQGRGLGLSEMLYRQLSSLQESKNEEE